MKSVVTQVDGLCASWVRSKVDEFREGSTKCQRAMMRLLLAVLRRSVVWTRTSTTPVWMGSVRVGALVLQKTDSSATTRGKEGGGFCDGLGASWVRSKVDEFREESTKCQRAMMRLLLAVLRRSVVWTRTSTTPVWMGSVRVGALVLQKTDSSATTRGKEGGGFGDGLLYELGAV